MIISVTSDHISAAIRGTILCPLFLALKAYAYDVQMIGVGVEHPHSDIPCARLYYLKGGDAIIQTLPMHVVQLLKSYDKTGVLAPFEFELPNP